MHVYNIYVYHILTNIDPQVLFSLINKSISLISPATALRHGHVEIKKIILVTIYQISQPKRN